jgi:GT2 family glycosyltransferase
VNRPEVSVVMPFGGHAGQARTAIEALRALDAGPGDELILADNSGVLSGAPSTTAADDSPPLVIVPAPGERTPAHARNAGARRATRDWILFLDADCRPRQGLLEAYFSAPVDGQVGALVGELVAAPGGTSLAARYGATRNFLGQQAHLGHGYLPRAAAANLLVRRSAFEQVGGFFEGVRAAEDTDFTWRLQGAGWRLEGRPGAQAEHTYRTSLGDLRRQWRGYAAGRAWLSRRYEGFSPEPAVVRALERTRRRLGRRRLSPPTASSPRGGRDRPGRRAPYLALDALLAVEELAGFALSNRPPSPPSAGGPVEVVLVADRFPGQGDPLVELAQAVGAARIEAAGRPDLPDRSALEALDVSYLEDDGAAARMAAGLALAIRHPVLVAQDLLSATAGQPSTWALAPAVLRLGRDRKARVHPLGGPSASSAARRLARLAGRPLER